MKKLTICLICLLFLCGCRTTVNKTDPLIGLPVVVTPVPLALPALKIVDEPKYLPPYVILGTPVPIEPEPELPKYLPPFRPELPPLPPLPDF